MKRNPILCLAFLVLVTLAPALWAKDFSGGIRLDMEPSQAEVATFRAYVLALRDSGDAALTRLGESARAAVEAVMAGDIEAFVAAKAVYDYRLETLTDEKDALLREIQDRLRAETEERPVLFEKVSVYYGCGAELGCLDSSTISCTCANSSGNCSYNPTYNAYGGRVVCDCAGTTYDKTRTCPFVPPTGCSLGCVAECGSAGGVCNNGICYCY